MSNITANEDYLDQLTYLLPIHRSLTSLEKLLIVFIVSLFVSFVGCTLLCLLYPRSILRRKYFSKQKFVQPIPRKSLLVVPPPSYDSVVKSNELLKQKIRTPSNGTVSDSDTIVFDGQTLRSNSARSSLSNGGRLSTITNTYPLIPYAEMNIELNFDFTKNLLNIHLKNGEHFASHPAFADQFEYFIRVQLVNNKLLKKFQESARKNRVSLPLNLWKKQQEKTTKNYQRTSEDQLTINENLLFQITKSDFALNTLRFSLVAIDRSGIEDLMFESLLPLTTSMIPKSQQTIQFKNLSEIVLSEVFVGTSYLPTSERFTLSLNKFRSFCKTEKPNDLRFLLTFYHNGRRFFQKKIPVTLSNLAIECEIKEILTQNIPQTDIQSVYIHLELNSTNFSSSILLGEHTRYQLDWQKMIEYPRQTHLRWYQFYA